MKNNKLTLLVCSNRKNVDFSLIWKNIIQDKFLSKIVLVTQSEANRYINNETKVVHIKLNNKGRSKAFNRGLEEITTSFVGITDDDCILNKNWVIKSINSLEKHNCDMVFGQTFPYQPEKHSGMVCPCIFTKNSNKISVTSHLVKHWEDVGHDNNAVARKSLFDKIGGYKWWLGPGSIGKSADDAEFILRTLITNHRICYNPTIVAYHNKWLTPQEWYKEMQIYRSGGIAAYGFYGLQGVTTCSNIVRFYVNQLIEEQIDHMRKFVKRKISFLNLIRKIYLGLSLSIRGIMIAFLFAKIIPVPEKEQI
jgi:glycosyltransferase involved in cell wall biosynthesis